MIHSRTAAKMKEQGKIKHYDDGLQRITNTNKHRYIYPLDKSLIPLCKSLSKPYPKNAQLHHAGDGAAIQPSGAFNSTAALNLQSSNSE
jgi:hypothetical protein